MDVAPWIDHWIILVSNGIQSYYMIHIQLSSMVLNLMVLHGFQWYPMVFNGIQWYPMVFNYFQWYWMVSVCLRWSQMIFDIMGWSVFLSFLTWFILPQNCLKHPNLKWDWMGWDGSLGVQRYSKHQYRGIKNIIHQRWFVQIKLLDHSYLARVNFPVFMRRKIVAWKIIPAIIPSF